MCRPCQSVLVATARHLSRSCLTVWSCFLTTSIPCIQICLLNLINSMSKIVSLLPRPSMTPLFQLITGLGGIHEAPDAIISRAKEIEEQNKRLLEGIEKIISQAYPEAKGNEIYLVWSQLPSLQGVDEESKDLAFYNNIRCLRRDSHKVDNYLKFLRCQIVHKNNC
ncbi:prolactin, isoform CRA_d [Rattus norvegicus]|uniref:Prolactin n=1 Tax=Rattus norvegicus TaxID=10116 RepID=A6KLD0_RAT|nr:prolactin, isoform CRA_d [Rattus norvegicus]